MRTRAARVVILDYVPSKSDDATARLVPDDIHM